MTILFLAPELKSDSWVRHLQLQEPELEVRVWPEVGRAEDILLALCWRHPPGDLLRYKNLRCVASLGFGVDHILRDPDLPAGVPVTRIVDPAMVTAMSEYILTAVLHHTRRFGLFARDQAERQWRPRRPLSPSDLRVGIMGLGHLGADAARKLHLLGFQVAGWSRSPKRLEGIACFSGDAELEVFLAQADVLVCLLPLTPATEGILNRRTLARLPAGAYVINVARGEHLVEEDLLAALESGHMSGACLDVFRKEPLPENHPFWNAPRISVTPHIASLTFPKDVAPQLIESYRRVRSGLLPLNVIDTQRGY